VNFNHTHWRTRVLNVGSRASHRPDYKQEINSPICIWDVSVALPSPSICVHLCVRLGQPQCWLLFRNPESQQNTCAKLLLILPHVLIPLTDISIREMIIALEVLEFDFFFGGRIKCFYSTFIWDYQLIWDYDSWWNAIQLHNFQFVTEVFMKSSIFWGIHVYFSELCIEID
jgi:hypothetical protein